MSAPGTKDTASVRGNVMDEAKVRADKLSLDEPFLNTATENTLNFATVRERYSSVAAFVSGEEHIAIRSTTVSREEADLWLKCTSDIDGVTVEWHRLSGTSHTFHHLSLAPRDALSLKKVYPMVKKHDRLHQRNTNSLRILKLCVGTQLFYDMGWEYYLCLVPEADCRITYEETVVRQLTLNWIRELRVNLQTLLRRCLDSGELLGTIDKNNMFDTKKWFILPDDSDSMLVVFDNTISMTIPPQGMRPLLFSFRFGEKSSRAVHIPIKDKQFVVRMCVHAAAVIEMVDDDDFGLLWSREGLSEVVGLRGCFSCAMSFCECSNFQSNLDGRPIDIPVQLRNLCRHPEHVQFVQLYADLPHRYPNTRFHPVSGAIVIGRALKSHSSALEAEAKAYVSEMRSNFLKVCRSKCRIEFVLAVPEVTDRLEPSSFIDSTKLWTLLQRKALIVPFIGQEVRCGLRDVGMFLVNELNMLLNQYSGSGHSEAVWQAYQYELACEKLLYGKPFCWRSNTYSVNLGVGLGWPTRSETDQRGFLCLSDKFACCEDELTMPPLDIYTRSEVVKTQLRRMYGFEDNLDGSPVVLGRRLFTAIIEDLFDIGVRHQTLEVFINSLKSSEGLKIVGRITVAQITNIIEECERWKPPCVSHFLVSTLKRNGRDLTDIVRDGLMETGFRYFPAVRRNDAQRHQYLNWEFAYGFWFVTDAGQAETVHEHAAVMCPIIVNELESRRLCFSSRLSSDTDVFPWVIPVLRKLRGRQLTEDELVKTLTFVTCIAFIQGSRFVDFNALSRLELDMAVSQQELRRLEILGGLLLPNVNTVRVWRLHSSIPCIGAPKATGSVPREDVPRRATTVCEVNEPPPERISEDTENTQATLGAISLAEPSKHLPNGLLKKWSAAELSIVGFVAQKAQTGTTMRAMYVQYVNECNRLGIPDRSFHAFRWKATSLNHNKTDI